MNQDIEVRKRIIVPLSPTETPAGGSVPRPSHTEVSRNLSPGVSVIRIYPDFGRGCWFVVLDVTDSPPHASVPPWAPGIEPPMLIPDQSVRAVQAATAAQPKIILPGSVPTARPRLELVK